MTVDRRPSGPSGTPCPDVAPLRPARAPARLTTRVAALVAALAAGPGACGPSTPARAGAPPVPVAPPAPQVERAQVGDTLYLIEYQVLAARRGQFERFVTESYWPALRQAARTDSGAARMLRTTRLLHPARPNDDGTLSYVLLIDPAVSNEPYSVRDVLARVYSAEETERRYRELNGSLSPSASRNPRARAFVQPAYPASAPGGGGAARP